MGEAAALASEDIHDEFIMQLKITADELRVCLHQFLFLHDFDFGKFLVILIDFMTLIEFEFEFEFD